MVNSGSNTNSKTHPNKKRHNSIKNSTYPKNLATMCKTATGIINQLYNPLDAINRFINLALQDINDDAQSRQFLIESKQGVRKTSHLLKKLNVYTKRIEKEIAKISQERR